MATQELTGAEPNELHTTILDTINKGHNYVADVLDYCGPRGSEQSRGLDCPAYMGEIDKLVEAGYLVRGGKRFNEQLRLELTEKGRQAAPDLSETEQTLLEEYDVSADALSVLKSVIEYESREGSLPSIAQIQEIDHRDSSSYQYTVLFNQLVDAGLASEKGIFRYRVAPTDRGRKLVEEYGDDL